MRKGLTVDSSLVGKTFVNATTVKTIHGIDFTPLVRLAERATLKYGVSRMSGVVVEVFIRYKTEPARIKIFRCDPKLLPEEDGIRGLAVSSGLSVQELIDIILEAQPKDVKGKPA